MAGGSPTRIRAEVEAYTRVTDTSVIFQPKIEVLAVNGMLKDCGSPISQRGMTFRDPETWMRAHIIGAQHLHEFERIARSQIYG